jgi:hypothetical protein
MRKENAVGLVEPDTPDAKFTPLMCNKTRVKGERQKSDDAARTVYAAGYTSMVFAWTSLGFE